MLYLPKQRLKGGGEEPFKRYIYWVYVHTHIYMHLHKYKHKLYDTRFWLWKAIQEELKRLKEVGSVLSPGGAYITPAKFSPSSSRDQWVNRLVFIGCTLKHLEIALHGAGEWAKHHCKGMLSRTMRVRRAYKKEIQTLPSAYVYHSHLSTILRNIPLSCRSLNPHSYHKHLSPWFCFFIL